MLKKIKNNANILIVKYLISIHFLGSEFIKVNYENIYIN